MREDISWENIRCGCVREHCIKCRCCEVLDKRFPTCYQKNNRRLVQNLDVVLTAGGGSNELSVNLCESLYFKYIDLKALNRIAGVRFSHLTRSRRSPAFNFGETPSITIAFWEDYFHPGEHASKYECRRRGEQGKTPRSFLEASP